jgi:hypothetical protein
MKDEDPDHVRGSWKNKSNWHPKIRWSPEPGPKWNGEFCSWAPDALFLPQGYARGPWSVAEWGAANASLNVDAMRSLWSLGCDGRQRESSPAQSSLIRPPNMPGEKAWSAHKWRRPKKLKLQSSVAYILELNPARTVVLVFTHHRLSWQTYGRASITFKHPTILKGAPVAACTQNI